MSVTIWWWVDGAHHIESSEGGLACCGTRIPDMTGPPLRCAVPPETLCGRCRQAHIAFSDPGLLRSSPQPR